MPASMMMAPVGSRPKVTGRSIVMVAMGPTPGRTPTSVPTRQPMKASPRFCAVKATWKPSARCCSSSFIGSPLERDDARDDQHRDREGEEVLEEDDAEGGQDEAEDHQLARPALGRGGAADDHHERPRHREPHR